MGWVRCGTEGGGEVGKLEGRRGPLGVRKEDVKRAEGGRRITTRPQPYGTTIWYCGAEYFTGFTRFTDLF